MKTFEELIQERIALMGKANAINDLAKSEDRALTTEEATEIKGLMAEVDGVTVKIAEVEENMSVSKDLEERAAQLKASPLPLTTPSNGVVSQLQHIKDNVLDDPKLGWGSFGEFAVASANVETGQGVDQRLRYGEAMMAAQGLSQNVPSDGGFLVPPEFSQNIEDRMRLRADNLMNLVDRFDITGESLTIPAVNETSRLNGSRYGGIFSHWINEADVITESKPTFRQLKLEPQELAVLVFATNKLLRNTRALEQFLTGAAEDEIIFRVNDAIINGTGAGQPKGIITSGATVQVDRETLLTVKKEDIDELWNRVPAKLRANVIWLLNQDVEVPLQALEQTVGTGGLPVYLPAGGLADAPNDRLKGRRTLPIEYCPALGSLGDIILADMRGYVIGVQSAGIEGAMSIHLKFDSAQTAFRWMFAIDGKTWLESSITAFKGATQRSSFAMLKATT